MDELGKDGLSRLFGKSPVSKKLGMLGDHHIQNDFQKSSMIFSAVS